jgi:hypothetical protein
MLTNESSADRFLRVVIGGAIGFCPLYRLLGVSSCRVGQSVRRSA